MRFAIIWVLGIVLCGLFIWAVLPRGGPVGHQYVMPLNWTIVSILVGGCLVILGITYFLSGKG